MKIEKHQLAILLAVAALLAWYWFPVRIMDYYEWMVEIGYEVDGRSGLPDHSTSMTFIWFVGTVVGIVLFTVWIGKLYKKKDIE